MVLSLFYFLSPSGTSSAHSEKARCLYEDYRKKIRQIEGFPRLKAVASITLDHQLIINDIKVLESENRCFIEFPRNSFAEFHNIENIIPTSKLRTDFENQIMEVFQTMRHMQIDSYEISY